jgi:hypothetical protein
MLALFLLDGSLAANAGSESIVDSTVLGNPGSKNSKVQVASDRFVDLFKRAARRKGEEKE